MALTKLIKPEGDERQEHSLSFSLTMDQELTDENFNARQRTYEKDKITNVNNSVQVYKTAQNVYALPENWPKIPQWKDHHWISELSSCKTPSVKRAVSHIKLIQNAVDEWFLRVTEEVKSRTSSLASSVPEYDLQVVPYLGAQEVIADVITLLAELENDRIETHEKYMKEIKRADWLRRQIDGMQLHHLQVLPALVQIEHEACIMDLTELNWHVAYTKRLLAKAQNKFTLSNRRNTQLKGDIDFVKQHVPLVQEKLVLEVEAMDKIRKAQGDTDQELVMAQQIQAKTEMRSQEAITKTNTEREHIRKELDVARDALNNICDQLKEAELTHEAYNHQMSDIYRKLVDNDQEMEVLKVRKDAARISEERQATKVRNIQAKVTEAELDHIQVEERNLQQEQELNKNKADHTNKVAELQQHRKDMEIQLQKLARENLECSMDVQDYEKKISKCDQKKTADVKNISRINQEIERTSIMLEQTIEQHRHISNTNYHLQDQLQLEKDKAFNAEDKLKKTVESLRRQMKDEIHTKSVLQARINSDLAETQTAQSEAAKRKDKAKSVVDELNEAISVVLQKVNKLQGSKAEMQQMKINLTTKIKETENQHKESNERFRHTLRRVEPQHQAVKSEQNKLSEQLQTMAQQSLTMKNKTEEMDGAQVMMERSVNRMNQDVQILAAEMHELDLQNDAGRKIMEDLRRQNNDTIDRLRNNENQHVDLQKERQKVLNQSETDKTHLMKKNRGLASKYRQLQNEYLISKELMLRSYDERVKFEGAIIDVKQLRALQSKLHGALSEYFKLRGLTTESELLKLEQESSVNGDRVQELKVKMERALDDISQFLKGQKDGRKVKQTAWETAKEKNGTECVPSFEGGLAAGDARMGVQVGLV